MSNDRGRSVLYVGDFCDGEGGTNWHRMEAMQALGYEVTPFDVNSPWGRRMERLFPARVLRRFFRVHIDWTRANRRLLALFETRHFDLLWVDKGLLITKKTLLAFKQRFPKGKVVGYSPDDMMNPNNQSRAFLASLPVYDLYFTTKSYNCAELEALGCPKTYFIGNAYHSKLHRPLVLSDEERKALGADVVFIGAWEPERAEMLRRLAEEGIDVRIWGPQWERFSSPIPPTMRLERRRMLGEDYTKVLNAAKIQLGFLRKVNRDLQTQRTMEIPAAGAFMLMERTDEQLALFEEGKEAEFFSSFEELLEKVRYYLEHDEERKAIARAGRERCLRSGYSNEERMKEMMAQVWAL